MMVATLLRADCYDLRMSVEGDADGWTLQVHNRDGQAVHSSAQPSLGAAKHAAAKFVVYRMTGAMGAATVDLVEQNLSWASH